MKIVFTKAGDVMVDGVKRGRIEPGIEWFRVIMDEPIFPHRRLGGHGFDRSRSFRTKREARERIRTRLVVSDE